MDAGFLSELTSLVAQIGVGNFLLVLVSLFVVTNLPTIIDKVINRKAQNERDKQHAADMTFLRTQITNIWEQERSTAGKLDGFNNTLDLQTQKVEDYTKMAADQNKQRVHENFMITESIGNIVDSIDSIEKMMRNVMSEKDALGLVGLKMGSVIDFKTRLEEQIITALTSDKKQGQIEVNITAVIRSEWLDLKSEFDAFSFPINMRNFLDKYEPELWADDGMFTVVKNMAINKNIELDRKMESISKQLDLGLRDLQAKLTAFIEKSKNIQGA